MVAGVAILAFAIPAIGANHTNAQDGNDTDGRFDLREVDLDHYPGPLRWTFRTFSSWSVAEMWDAGYLVVELDTRGDNTIDERIVVRSDGRSLVAKLFAVRSDGSSHVIEELHAMKDSRRAASVEVALRRLAIGRARDAFEWYATSLFTGPSCQRVCIDRVPDDGRLQQLLRGVSPSPTPTGPTGATTGATAATVATGATGATGTS
jgi:hypothetical protein